MTFSGTKELEFMPLDIEFSIDPSPPFSFKLCQAFEGYGEPQTRTDPASSGEDFDEEWIEIIWNQSDFKHILDDYYKDNNYKSYEQRMKQIRSYKKALTPLYEKLAKEFIEEHREEIDKAINKIDVTWEEPQELEYERD